MITVRGMGAVSAAGWGLPALMELVDGGRVVEISTIERTTEAGETISTRVARVPALEDRSRLAKSPRLRRASAVGKFAAAAVLEALGEERCAAVWRGEFRLGVVCTIMNGCVNYSNRFFGEVLADPSVASPILFPETVYNAPSSHLSAMLGSTAPNDTLIGDGAEFFTGLDLAAEWLERGDCDACVVVSAEEIDWLSAEALNYYESGMFASEGAAAVLLERDGEGPALWCIPEQVGYAEISNREEALRRVWNAMGQEDDGTVLLSDGRCGVARFDRAESEVFAGWKGERISVRQLLGEAMGASAGFQTIAALEKLRLGAAERAVVTVVGGNEGVAGAAFAARKSLI